MNRRFNAESNRSQKGQGPAKKKQQKFRNVPGVNRLVGALPITNNKQAKRVAYVLLGLIALLIVGALLSVIAGGFIFLANNPVISFS